MKDELIGLGLFAVTLALFVLNPFMFLLWLSTRRE